MKGSFRTPSENALFEELLSKRGIVTPEARDEFFAPDYEKHLHSPFLFREMEAVVLRVAKAMQQKETVGIFGDFDADGVTGSALLREGLSGLGLKTLVYIPDKSAEGHGVSMAGVESFLEQGVTLLFTVDCGISNKDEIAYAKEHGMETIVIDHHHVPEVLPPSIANINPKLPGCGYPFSELCGAGTAFKVLQGLYRRLAPEKEEQLKWLLDLAAVGTVADCMPIVGENRVIVKYGLIVLSKTRRMGLKELFEVGRIRIGEESLPDAETIGFSIAPRLNAAGRMAHAIVAHELLVTDDRARARELAETLEKHNRDRQKITTSITEEVRGLVREKFAQHFFILAAEPHYPLGIVGLVAGRIAEEFQKPAAILARGETESHGSFRSVPGVNIIEAIEQCKDLLVRFGGHAQAAGMIIKNENLDPFYDRFHTLIEEKMQHRNTAEKRSVQPDAEADMHLLSLDFVSALKRFEPFGMGNEEPLFLFRGATVMETRFVGNGEKHLKMVVEVGDGAQKKYVDAIGFHLGGREAEFPRGSRADITGYIRENAWNGRKNVQILVKEMQRV